MILGLTGGLGCGKSTAARLFVNHGVRFIDSDAMIRDHIYAQKKTVDALRVRFGEEAVAADGSVNRAYLANIVFSDAAQLRWLEDLVHPPLFARWRELIGQAPDAPWLIEVPLLFEKQLENWFDFIVCVACTPSQQLARLEQRGMDRSLAAQRISKQLPLARKIELSDHVLLNDGSSEFLSKQVDLLLSALPGGR